MTVASGQRRWRRARRGLLTLALIVALPFLAFGCTSSIAPPERPSDPTTVFLLGEAMHSGIVLPPNGRDDEFVEFGYGDWSWFALGNDAWYDAFATVLWPTAGALGRRTFGARDAATLRSAVYWAELSPVVVSAAKANALRERLQRQFDAGQANAVRRADLGFTFVPMDRSYWFADNCADAAADWFVELGCDVGWAPVRIALEVDDRARR